MCYNYRELPGGGTSLMCYNYRGLPGGDQFYVL